MSMEQPTNKGILHTSQTWKSKPGPKGSKCGSSSPT
jgi:hypothetical protein